MTDRDRDMIPPDRAPAAPEDLKHISLGQDREVRYWSHRLNAPRERLEEAVEKVGPHVNAVTDYLHRNS